MSHLFLFFRIRDKAVVLSPFKESSPWCLLISVLTLWFTILGVPILSQAQDLTVDNGTSYNLGDPISIQYRNETIGSLNNGTFLQTGGSNSVTNKLILGDQAGSNGTYTLNDGILTVARYEYVGNYGTGSFTQNGGTHIVSGLLVIGERSGGNGTYNLAGGSFSAHYLDVYRGVFTQNGGISTLTHDLWISGDNGTYNLNGGSLSASAEIIGYGGTGTFTQSGGINTTGELDIGNTNGIPVGTPPPGNGSYVLKGGSLFANREWVGGETNGTFLQTGGTNTADELNVLSRGSYDQSGGTTRVGKLLVGDAKYTLSGGSLIAGTFLLYPFGVFNQTGGTLNVTNFYQQGGEVQGNLENRGTFNYESGAFSGRLLNYGAIKMDADFTAANGLANYSSTPFTIDAGRTVTLNGQGLDNQGIIFVNGTLTGNGTLLNNTSGFLGGSGTISGNFVNSGMASAGDGVGTLNITGSFTQTATGTLGVEIDSATNYDKLNVTGTAALNGSLKAVFTGGYVPEGNQFFSGVLTATGGITGTFSNIDYLTPTLSLRALYNANSVDLLVQRDYISSGLDLTYNQQAVGNMLQGIAGVTSGDLNDALNSIDHLGTSPAVRDAFQQISPDKAAAFSTLAFTNSALQFHALSNRLNNIRFAEFGIPGASKGFALDYSNGGSLMLTSAPSSNSARDLDGKSSFDFPGLNSGHSGIYIEPGLARGWQNTTANQTGFDFTMGGFTAGTDFLLSDNFLVGIASGYTRTASDFSNSGGSIDANSIPLNLYAAYIPKPFYAVGSAGYTLNLFDLDRDLNFGGLARTAKSSATGHQFNAYGETGYDFKMGSLVLTPNATLAYSHLWVDGFTESGADSLNLTVSSQSAESLQTGLGGRITFPFEACGLKIFPQLFASYQHEFSNDSRGLDARLPQIGNTFTFRTDALDRDFALLGGTLAAAGLAKNLIVQLDYSAELGRDNYTAHFVNAGLKYTF